MASLDQVLQMGGGGAGYANPTATPTARPGTPTGGPPPMLGQAMAGMQPGGPRFAPGAPGSMEEMAMAMDGPELAQLFGEPPDLTPPLSLMDVLRLLKMQGSWNDGSADYGAIL